MPWGPSKPNDRGQYQALADSIENELKNENPSFERVLYYRAEMNDVKALYHVEMVEKIDSDLLNSILDLKTLTYDHMPDIERDRFVVMQHVIDVCNATLALLNNHSAVIPPVQSMAEGSH